MKKIALNFALVAACGVIAYAGPESIRSSSKEMKETVAPAPPACDFSWTGFYIGIKGGYGWSGDSDVSFDPLPDPVRFRNLRPQSLSPDFDGFVGGGELGFNWQLGHFVLGVATDFFGADMDGTVFREPIIQNNGTPFNPGVSFLAARQNVDWFGTFRGRIGFAPFCRLLIYGTGGVAYGDTSFDAVAFFGPPPFETYVSSREDTDVGWTGGGGLEFAVSRHWTLKAEYLYIDLGDHSVTATQFPVLPPFAIRNTADTQFHTITGGINFKF